MFTTLESILVKDNGPTAPKRKYDINQDQNPRRLNNNPINGDSITNVEYPDNKMIHFIPFSMGHPFLKSRTPDSNPRHDD